MAAIAPTTLANRRRFLLAAGPAATVLATLGAAIAAQAPQPFDPVGFVLDLNRAGFGLLVLAARGGFCPVRYYSAALVPQDVRAMALAFARLADAPDGLAQVLAVLDTQDTGCLTGLRADIRKQIRGAA